MDLIPFRVELQWFILIPFSFDSSSDDSSLESSSDDSSLESSSDPSPEMSDSSENQAQIKLMY